MAQLADALHQSPLSASYVDTSDGNRILVQRSLAQPAPDSAERYVVRIEHGIAMPEWLFEAATFDELLARLRTLNFPDFTPDADVWTPTTTSTAVASTEWSADVSTRGLSPEDSAEGRHANDSNTLPPV